jgi:hypothetical protein
MAKIRTTLSNLSDADAVAKGNVVFNNMENNLHFPNPIPNLPEVKTGLDAFTGALANMGSGKEQTIIKNKSRENFSSLYNRLALHVQATSKGDELALESSGFDIISRRTAVGVLTKPESFGAKPGEVSGSVKLSMKAIDGAKSYIYMYTSMPLADDSDWTSTFSSRASVTITGLVSGTQYCFRAVAVGTDPTLVYSDDVSSYVL